MTEPMALAYFIGGGDALLVHFNPASLKISLTNQFGEDPPEQHARATSSKLDVELVFDTTDTGEDVRNVTEPLRMMATATGTETAQKKSGSGKSGKPAKSGKDEANRSLAQVTFNWGTATYTGVIESLTDTIDYWSSDGVPLRSTIQLSMKGDASRFFSAGSTVAYTEESAVPPLDDFIPVTAMPGTTGATDAAAQMGDPGAGRILAAQNGLENMRAPVGATMGAAASVNLSAAVGFQMSGGISAGASVGFGIGASAGASASAGLSAGVGVGMSAGAGIGMGGGAGIGMSAGAGMGMSAGAGVGMSAGAGIGMSAGAGIGMSAGAGIGMSAGAGIGIGGGAGGIGIGMTSTTSVTGLDGVTHTETSSSITTIAADGTTVTRSATAGISMSEGAFAGLGMSKTTLPSASYNPNLLLGDASPSVGPDARFDATGKLVGGGGQVAASYTANASVTIF